MAEVTAEVSPGSLLSGTLPSYGPLLSLVIRTEDVWQKYNQFIEACRGSQSGFPLLPPTMQTGQDSDGGGVILCALYSGVMLWGCLW